MTSPRLSFSFGSTAEVADDRAGKVVSGQKTASSALLPDGPLEKDEWAMPGTQAIILDGRKRPTAIVETTSASVLAFEDVSEAQALRDGYASLRDWRSYKEAHLRDEGRQSDGVRVLYVEFKLISVLPR